MDSIDSGAGPAHAKANTYRCGQVRKSMGRHNQVEVHDWNGFLLLSTDKVNFGHTREQTPHSASKTWSASPDTQL